MNKNIKDYTNSDFIGDTTGIVAKVWNDYTSVTLLTPEGSAIMLSGLIATKEEREKVINSISSLERKLADLKDEIRKRPYLSDYPTTYQE